MVESINGPGKRIIITTKPKAKEKTSSKDGSFDKALKEKAGAGKSVEQNLTPTRAQTNMKIIQQQQLARMNKLQNIANQIQDGTYKLVEPEVLANKLYSVITDKSTREKFIKKLLKEEAEKLPQKGKQSLSDLELKKLVFMIKESQDEPFEDPELDALLEQFS
jgi:anti-sigma28 factor (negative regulator of flagellin synthesis)